MSTNFGNQWIEIFAAGAHTDSTGRRHEITPDFLDAVVANFNPAVHEPPAVVGHPREDAPAYGWVKELRRNGESLEARFADVDVEFERLHREGRFKKRSASFYTDASAVRGGRVPCLRHVGFLGAQPPAVKGLRPVHFSDDGATTFEISFGENAMDEKQVKDLSERVSESAFEGLMSKLKSAFGFGDKDNSAATASFSESQVRELIDQAVGAVKADFSERLTAVQNENKELKAAVARASGATTRTEIVAFCDSLGAAKLPPGLRKAGVVEFMEALAQLPAEQKVTVISFSEEGGKRAEKKIEITPLQWFKDFLEKLGPFVQFGEAFAEISANGDGGDLIDPARRKKLRSEMGLATKEGK